MSEINVKEEFKDELNRIITLADSLCLPELTLTTTGNNSTIAGTQYLWDMYESFRSIVENYSAAIKRDAALVADIAQSFLEYDSVYSGIPYVDSWFPSVNRCIYSTVVNYSVNSSMTISDTWDFNKYELDLLVTQMIENLYELITSIPDLKRAIRDVESSEYFTGVAATATKRYFFLIHNDACSALYVSIQTILCEASAYWLGYRDNQEFDMVNYECFYSKSELNQLVNGLTEKLSNLENLHSGLLEQTNYVASATGGLYDYYGSLPNDSALINLLPSVIARTQSVIDTVENNEAALASSYSVSIDSILTVFASFVQDIITNGNRSNFAFPPQNANELIDVASYHGIFAEVEVHNECEMARVMCYGLSEANEVRTCLVCEEQAIERRNRVFRGYGAIVAGIISVVVTLGADAPVSLVLISVGVQEIALTYYSAEIYENIDEIQMLHQGIIDPEGYNYVREGIISWSATDFYQHFYHRDPTAEEIQAWYVNSRTAVFAVSSVLTSTTLSYSAETGLFTGNNLSFTNAIGVNSCRYLVRRATNDLLLCIGFSDGQARVIMIPLDYFLNTGVNSRMGLDYNIQGAVTSNLRSPTYISSTANTVAGEVLFSEPRAEDVTLQSYGIEIGLDDLEYIQEAERLGLCGGGF